MLVVDTPLILGDCALLANQRIVPVMTPEAVHAVLSTKRREGVRSASMLFDSGYLEATNARQKQPTQMRKEGA